MSEKKTHSDSPTGGGFGAIRENRPRVLLGVSGSVAAYKAVDLASKLGVENVIVFSGLPGGAPGDSTPNWITAPWPA